MKFVPPGHYRALAFEHFNAQYLQNAEVMDQLAAKGLDLDLKPGDQKQLQLALITDDELDQIYLRLGIDSQN